MSWLFTIIYDYITTNRETIETDFFRITKKLAREDPTRPGKTTEDQGRPQKTAEVHTRPRKIKTNNSHLSNLVIECRTHIRPSTQFT